ncbi:PilZ domain-containing protein [Niveispirillum sp. KHB5.9]|uniref:PilZ domain-containing protein n=1 Tax=Niveispirillum sp. KHB5.9 TaxID=3400269 RepID=UPI003A854FC4
MPVMSPIDWIKGLFKPNRRRFDRHAVQFGIRLQAGGQTYDCDMRDVSPSGALLVDAPNLPIGTMTVLEIPQIALSTDARVVRRTELGIGIEFSRDGVGAIVAGWAKGLSPVPE